MGRGGVRRGGMLPSDTLPLGKQCSRHVRPQRTRPKCRHCFNGPQAAYLPGWVHPAGRFQLFLTVWDARCLPGERNRSPCTSPANTSSIPVVFGFLQSESSSHSPGTSEGISVEVPISVLDIQIIRIIVSQIQYPAVISVNSSQHQADVFF